MLIKDLNEKNDSEIKKILDSEFFKTNYVDALKLVDSEEAIDTDFCKKCDNLYRGMASNEEKLTYITPNLKGRKPSNTNVLVHNYVNMVANEVLGVPVRNLTFGTKKKDDAEYYGEVYVLFPLGNYSLYVMSDTIDFTSTYEADGSFIGTVFDDVSFHYDSFDEEVLFRLSSKIEDEAINEFDFSNPKSFKKSVDRLASLIANAYIKYASDDNTLTTAYIKRVMTEQLENYFKEYYEYVVGIESYTDLKKIGDEEVMVDAQLIAAIRADQLCSVLRKLWRAYNSV